MKQTTEDILDFVRRQREPVSGMKIHRHVREQGGYEQDSRVALKALIENGTLTLTDDRLVYIIELE